MSGKNSGQGMSIIELMELFPDEESAKKWFEEKLWPDGRVCGHCGSTRTNEVPNSDPMPYHCADCREYFSVRTGTVMHRSKIPLRKWVLAFYRETTSPKGVSSVQLAKDIGVSQKSTWFMLHRIREAWATGTDDDDGFSGPVEVDETHIGPRRRNLSNRKRRALWRAGIKGAVNQSIVVGMRDRETGVVRAEFVPNASREVLHEFVTAHASPGAVVYTDEAVAYKSLPNEHHSVNHSMFEYARGEVSTNGIESFWSLVKRSHKGVYHEWSQKHLHRYIHSLAARSFMRKLGVEERMSDTARRLRGKRLPYKKLVADNGLPSGSRPTAIQR